MASDSLGTMTVGVTANVSDAERALNSLASMLEKFDRQQQSRSRGSAKVGAIAETEENMKAIGDAFKAGGDKGVEEYLSRTNRAIQQVGDTSARTRYAVLNLGYGVQDAVQVFGTSGFAGAIRASANNLQGLGVLFDKTAGGMKGLTAALMSGEFVVMGIATAVLLAANAWENYNKSVEEALNKESQEKFRRLKPERAVEEAGREEALNRELARMAKLNEAEAKRKQLVDDLAVANAKVNAAGKEEAVTQEMIAKRQKELAEYDRVRGFAPFGKRRVGGRDPDVQRRTAEEEAVVTRVEEGGGRAKLVSDLKDLQEKYDKFLKGPMSPEAVLRERDMKQKELDASTKRVGELQPDAIANAYKQVQAYERQIKAIDALIKKEEESGQSLRSQKRVYDDMQKAYETGVEKQKKIDEEFKVAVLGRGNPFAQRRLREGLEKKYGLTKEEKEAMGVLGTVGGIEDKAAFDQQFAKQQERADRYVGIMETLKKRLADLFKTYPQFGPAEQPLEAQQSDMEYRVSFLNKKRREVEARMRRGDQFTGVSPFESATAYEALARSRMGPSPESDVLKRILAAEEKATSALEDIREKLDPGRRERLVILESFE